MNVVDPIIVEERVQGLGAEIVLRVPQDLDYFKGHFPGVPILPGVVQIKWAISIARRCLALDGEFGGMETLKFQQVIRPEDRVTLSLTYVEETRKLRFAFHSVEGRHSTGCIRFGPVP